MKSPIIIKNKVHVDIADEIMRFALRVGTVFCALIGVWAFSCLAAALIRFGPSEVARGYITAITGF